MRRIHNMPKAKDQAVPAIEPVGRFGSPCPTLEQKIVWLKIGIAGALLASLGLSWRLWISARTFPLIPVSGALPAIPFPLDYICFFAMIGLLVVIFFVARPQKIVAAFLVVAALLALFDQNRWQPWFYQCCFMFLALAIFGWKKPPAALNALRLIVICTYLWSGLQKLNANFVRETWPDMSGPAFSHLPHFVQNIPPLFWLIIPLVEVAVAIGLLTRTLRNFAVALAIVTHVAILLTLIASHENSVVWPWNLAMILFVIVLFWQEKETTARQLFDRSPFQMAVLLFFGVLPALNFAGLWDSYLSAALYSGNTDQQVIYVSPAVIARLPPTARPHVWQASEPFFLDVNRWSYGELNVPIYPEPRIYRRVTERVCSYAGSASGDVRLRIIDRPNLFTGVRKSESYDCDHLDAIP